MQIAFDGWWNCYAFDTFKDVKKKWDGFHCEHFFRWLFPRPARRRADDPHDHLVLIKYLVEVDI